MTAHALVKVHADLYAPGGILSATTVKWLAGWGRFHTRRIIYPKDALYAFTSPALNGERIVSQDFFHIRLSSMDDEYCGALDSGMEFIWTDTQLDQFLGDDLHRIAATAINKSAPYKDFRTHAAWMELWEYDERARTGKFITEIKWRQLMEEIKTPS